MSVEDYTPTTAEVLEAYAATRCDGSDDHEKDPACVADFGFNRWLHDQILRVRANAWDEGFHDGVMHERREQRVSVGLMTPEAFRKLQKQNPYRVKNKRRK